MVFLCNTGYADDFFFFSSRRRHTRCLSDWSSDVCSSDLEIPFESHEGLLCARVALIQSNPSWDSNGISPGTLCAACVLSSVMARAVMAQKLRSEERRVGKEGRSRGSPDH